MTETDFEDEDWERVVQAYHEEMQYLISLRQESIERQDEELQRDIVDNVIAIDFINRKKI